MVDWIWIPIAAFAGASLAVTALAFFWFRTWKEFRR